MEQQSSAPNTVDIFMFPICESNSRGIEWNQASDVPNAALIRVEELARARPQDARDQASLRAWAESLHRASKYALFSGHLSMAENMASESRSAFADLITQRFGSLDVSAYPRGGNGLADYENYLEAWTTVCRVLAAQEKWAACERLTTELVSRLHKFIGIVHPQPLIVRCLLARTYWHLERLTDAESLTNQIFEVSETPGYEEPDWMAKSVMVLVDMSAGYFAEAEDMQKEAIDWLESTVGERHPNTIACKIQLGSIYMLQGRVWEAGELLMKMLEIQIEITNFDHYICEKIRKLIVKLEKQR